MVADEALLARAREALAPIETALRAGGYSLEVGSPGTGLALTVVAGPEACAECLTPPGLLRGMAGQALAAAGVEVAPGELDVTYPAGHRAA